MPNNSTNYSSLNIRLDSSVKSLSRTVAYHLSGTIVNGMMFTDSRNIIIYSDHIDFGRCGLEYRKKNEEIKQMNEILPGTLILPGTPGNLIPYFIYANGRVTYQFGPWFKYDNWSKRLDYDGGSFNPTKPDNEEIFSLLYPRFA